MDRLTGYVSPSPASERLKSLYEEYAAHESAEAKYVKSLDLFDMFLQAYEYEQLQGVRLDEFFAHVDKHSFEPQVKEWIDELMHVRNSQINILPKDSNLNTILKHYLNK